MDTSKEIRNRYSKEAETYRRDAWLINIDAPTLFEEFRNIIRKLYPDNMASLKILDLGAGNGMLTELILKEFPNANVTMLDFSEVMLDSAKAIFVVNNISVENIEFIVSNFITEEFPNEKYDLVISSYALHHVRNREDLETVYLKIANVLKESGSFICLDNYLGEDASERDKQVTIAFDKWRENYNSKEIAKNWAEIIKGEDTPATIAMIISSLNKCNNCLPFISSKVGVLAFIYGMTKVSLDKLKSNGLDELMNNINKYIGKEELIASYPFDKYL